MFNLLLLSAVLVNYIYPTVSELKLVHVVFRHGDRTNDISGVYPKDPFANETYYPYGLGQLTNAGRKREYLIGKSLRKRYNNFLGKVYTPNVLEAFSTDNSRTKMSLQLVLAGLYDPENTELEWNKEIKWQPIPYNYLPSEQDRALVLPHFVCANYIKAYDALMKTSLGRKSQKKYEDLFNYLTRHTGVEVNSTLDAFWIYLGLNSEKDWGFELPTWTIPVFPTLMKRMAILQYYLNSATSELKQLSGGFFLRKMLNDMDLKMTEKLIPADRKIFLYSGHEMNMAAILQAMEVYFPHIPPFGSYILAELHEINGVYGIKIYYQDYSSFLIRSLIIPGCKLFCPFEKFYTILKDNIPVTDDECG